MYILFRISVSSFSASRCATKHPAYWATLAIFYVAVCERRATHTTLNSPRNFQSFPYNLSNHKTVWNICKHKKAKNKIFLNIKNIFLQFSSWYTISEFTLPLFSMGFFARENGDLDRFVSSTKVSTINNIFAISFSSQC